MPRASRLVGFVPVGFLVFTAILAGAAVAGGWTVTATPQSGYGIDEVVLR